MARIRVIAAGAVAAALGAALVTGPATAAEVKSSTPERYLGDATGRALNLAVLNTKLTLGHSTATAALDPAAEAAKKLTASATGAGQLATLGSTVSTAADATAQSAVGTEKCAQVLGVANVVNAGLACGVSASKIVGDLPQATAEGRVANLDVSVNELLKLLPVTPTVDATLDNLLTTVGNLAPDAIDPAVTTIDQLLDSIIETKTLKVTVGKSTSSVLTEAGKVTSEATAAGAKVEILPNPVLGNLGVVNEPMATITVSSSAAKAVYDRKTEAAVPSYDAALVTVRLAAPLTNVLGGGVTEIKVAPGETLVLFKDTPLESEIVVADGSVSKNAATGEVRAVADGVKLHLLRKLGDLVNNPSLNGGVLLELAHSEAGVRGAAPTQVLGEQITPRSIQELPRTGGPAAFPLIGSGLFVAALAFRRLFNR